MGNYQPAAMEIADLLMTHLMAKIDTGSPEMNLACGETIDDVSEEVRWDDASAVAHFRIRTSDGAVHRLMIATELTV